MASPTWCARSCLPPLRFSWAPAAIVAVPASASLEVTVSSLNLTDMVTAKCYGSNVCVWYRPQSRIGVWGRMQEQLSVEIGEGIVVVVSSCPSGQRVFEPDLEMAGEISLKAGQSGTCLNLYHRVEDVHKCRAYLRSKRFLPTLVCCL